MTTQHLTIITGASRGLGRALADALTAQPGHTVLGLSRRPPAGAPTPPGATAPLHWACDLAEPQPVAERLAQWLGGFSAAHFASATLINNAALLSEPQPLAEADVSALSQSVRVGLEAPLLLTAAFLRATRGWTARRRVLHISSGVGRRGMASAAPYCAVKAGLDNLARAQAAEEALQRNGARVVSLAPGVIATDMQVQLRSADPQAFPDREAYVQLHSGGRLDTPQAAAAKVLRYLERADFGANPVADVRDP